MKVITLFLYVLFTMVLVLAFFTVGPWIETKYFPVYSKFTIVESQQTPEGLQMVARFTKKRNCDPQGYGWFVGDFGALRQVRLHTLPGYTIHRPLGTQLTQPFVVKELTVADLANIYAEVYHRCHPLWITRTVIYP